MSAAKTGIRWSGCTDVGRYRKNNEDAFLALTFDAHQIHYLGKEGEASIDGDYLFAVSDGMGGAQAGEFASRIAVDKISELMPRSLRLGAAGIHRGELDFLEELFPLIHDEMKRMSDHYEECRGMGATLSLLWLTPGKSFFAHVGDSRLYYLPALGDELMQLSEDHTHVGWLLREGQITASQARTHPKRNLLQQVLGGEARVVEPQLGSLELEAGDLLMLCSDGVTDGVSDRRLHTLLREPPPRFAELPPAERLVREALEEGSRDNVTALVIEIQ